MMSIKWVNTSQCEKKLQTRLDEIIILHPMIYKSSISPLLLFLILSGMSASAGPKDMRITNIEMHPSLVTGLGYPGGIPPHFLKRAKGLGFTHVMIQITPNEAPSDWNATTGTYDWSGPRSTFNTLVEAFKAVHANGMAPIPRLEISSKHTGILWDQTNNNIHWNTGIQYHSSGTRTTHKMNSYRNDPAGFDTTFQEMLVLIDKAFDSAKSVTAAFPDSLEYIHLGHGEIIVQDSGQPCSVNMIGSVAGADRTYIEFVKAGTTLTYPQIFRVVIEDEIYRRLQQVHSKINSGMKIIIDADAWDSQHNGRISARKDWGSSTCDISTGDVAKLEWSFGGLLNRADSLRKYLILMPWSYSTTYREFNYNVDSAYSHFKNNGLKFMPSFCVADNGLSVAHWQQAEGRLTHLRELVTTSRKPEYSAFVLGFNSYHFVGTGTLYHVNNGLDPAYKTMEHLSFWFGARSILPFMSPLLHE